MSPNRGSSWSPFSPTVHPEGNGNTATAWEFPGCVAYGDTSSEALARLEEVAVDWINAALEQGQLIPQPLNGIDYSGKLVLRMTKSLHQRAAMYADREGVSLNQFIVTCLSEAVGERARPALMLMGMNYPAMMGANYGALMHTFGTATTNYDFSGTSGSNISPLTVNTGSLQTGQMSAATSNELIAFPLRNERKREHA
jgi:antitoxin HicB